MDWLSGTFNSRRDRYTGLFNGSCRALALAAACTLFSDIAPAQAVEKEAVEKEVVEKEAVEPTQQLQASVSLYDTASREYELWRDTYFASDSSFYWKVHGNYLLLKAGPQRVRPSLLLGFSYGRATHKDAYAGGSLRLDYAAQAIDAAFALVIRLDTEQLIPFAYTKRKINLVPFIGLSQRQSTTTLKYPTDKKVDHYAGLDVIGGAQFQVPVSKQFSVLIAADWRLFESTVQIQGGTLYAF